MLLPESFDFLKVNRGVGFGGEGLEKKLIFGRAVQEPAGNAKNPVIPNCCIECETSKL